jgi:putative transposase
MLDREAALKAMKRLGDKMHHSTSRWSNNRAENSHQLFRRRERAMARFRSTKSLQKFVSIHASDHNHFNLERHLCNRHSVKLNRDAALTEWRPLLA